MLCTGVIFIINSCGGKVFNTEIFCPDGSRILIKFADAKDVKLGIEESYLNSKKLGTKEVHTIIRFKDKRSLRIERISPEEMIKCSLKQSEAGLVEKEYIRRF